MSLFNWFKPSVPQDISKEELNKLSDRKLIGVLKEGEGITFQTGARIMTILSARFDERLRRLEYKVCERPGWAWVENKQGFLEWCCGGHKNQAEDDLKEKKNVVSKD